MTHKYVGYFLTTKRKSRLFCRERNVIHGHSFYILINNIHIQHDNDVAGFVCVSGTSRLALQYISL